MSDVQVSCATCMSLSNKFLQGVSRVLVLDEVMGALYARVSTTPGNVLEFKNPPGNLLEFNWSSWKFLCKMSKIDRIGFQS